MLPKFSERFKDVRPVTLAASVIFKAPVVREIAAWLGVRSVQRDVFRSALARGARRRHLSGRSTRDDGTLWRSGRGHHHAMHEPPWIHSHRHRRARAPRARGVLRREQFVEKHFETSRSYVYNKFRVALPSSPSDSWVYPSLDGFRSRLLSAIRSLSLTRTKTEPPERATSTPRRDARWRDCFIITRRTPGFQIFD